MWFVVLVLLIVYVVIKNIKINTGNPYYQYKKEQDKMVNDFVHVNKILMEQVNKPEVLAKVQNQVAAEFNRPDIKISLDDLESQNKNITFDSINEILDSLPTKAIAILWCYITNEINMIIDVAKISKHDFYYLNIKQDIKDSIIRTQAQMRMVYLQRQDSFKLMTNDFILEHLALCGVDDKWYELWACMYRGYEYYKKNKKEFENMDSNFNLTDINLFPDLDEYDY